MPLLPAVCDTCSTVWAPNAISVEGVTGLTISNVSVGPCPTCGGTGRIPDGVYSATTNTISVFANTLSSARSLERLRTLLELARERGSSAEEVQRELAADPDLGPVAALVAKLLASGFDFKGWLSIALAVIGIWLAIQSSIESADEARKVDAIYNRLVTVATPAPTPTRVTPVRREHPKLGRNDLCPCGSGRKFKRCHGAS